MAELPVRFGLDRLQPCCRKDAGCLLTRLDQHAMPTAPPGRSRDAHTGTAAVNSSAGRRASPLAAVLLPC